MLGHPDYHDFEEEGDADHVDAVDTIEPLVINEVATERMVPQRAWLLSLTASGFAAPPSIFRQGLVTDRLGEPIVGGMSGSPIVNDAGMAIGGGVQLDYSGDGKANSRLCAGNYRLGCFYSWRQSRNNRD